jgi:hypothetical protein
MSILLLVDSISAVKGRSGRTSKRLSELQVDRAYAYRHIGLDCARAVYGPYSAMGSATFRLPEMLLAKAAQVLLFSYLMRM